MTSKNPIVQSAINSRTAKNRKIANACVAKNAARFIGRPPAKVKALVDKYLKVLDLVGVGSEADRLSAEVYATGWTYDDMRDAWVFDDSDIKADVKYAFSAFLDKVTRNDLIRTIESVQDKKVVADFKTALALAQKYAR